MRGSNTDAGDVSHAEVVLRPDWSVRYTRLAGYAIYGVTILAGIMVGSAPNDGKQLLGMVAIVWSMSYFCALDARAHGVVFVQSFWMLTSAGWPFSILCHLIRVRGTRGALNFALHGALWLFCAATSIAIGSLLRR